jgi:hypothetical protein
MQHRSLKHLLVVALLAGGLAVLSPTQVRAAPFDGPQGLWTWLARVWGEGATVLWEHPRAEHPAPSRNGHWAEQGVCIDPNGSVSSMTSPAGPRCRLWDEQGVCIDPNG